jgi:CO/xanthine dehydrogenase Mo-binding subunit
MEHDTAAVGLSRRGFIVASLSAAGGLMLGISPAVAQSPAEIGAWIVIDPDESITIRVAKSEMGQGIYTSLPMIVAEVVEISLGGKGEVHVERVVAAVDCGHVINPRLVEMQIESGVIYGLTAALGNAITVKDGAVEQANFDSYPMLRLADAPRIETHLALSRGKRWGGIGEPGTPPIAPAVCNAVFALTGKRIRSLPISDTDLSSRT